MKNAHIANRMAHLMHTYFKANFNEREYFRSLPNTASLIDARIKFVGLLIHRYSRFKTLDANPQATSSLDDWQDQTHPNGTKTPGVSSVCPEFAFTLKNTEKM